jgi:AcrR family transcriptional regulator
VFAERGFQATSMQDLTEATGLAAGGLYHYIGSKQQLLLKIFEQLMEPLLEQAREIERTDDPPAEQLRALLRVWLDHIERHQDHMLVFAQERHVVERGEGWEQVRTSRDEFEAILDRLLQQVGAGRDRRLTLLALLGMVNYTPQWFRAGGRLTATEIADGYFEMVMSGSASGDADRARLALDEPADHRPGGGLRAGGEQPA